MYLMLLSLTGYPIKFVNSIKIRKMTINYAIRAIAGTFIIVSLLLGYTVNELWFLFTAFVGLNLIQSSFTKWCLMEKILIKAGMEKSGDDCSC